MPATPAPPPSASARLHLPRSTVGRGALLVVASPVLALAVLVSGALPGHPLQLPVLYLAVVVLLVAGLVVVVVGALAGAVGAPASEGRPGDGSPGR